ncbi:hypothetical protein D3C77_152090 [compost metagenome]
MTNTQHHSPCQVLLHPAACSSPSAVAAIQQRTGLLIIITPKGRATAQPRTAVESHGPFGGDAA